MMTVNGKDTYIGQPINEYFSPQGTIGNYCSIAEGVIFCGSMNHVCVIHPLAVTTFMFNERWKIPYFEGGGVSRGPITIGNDVWIGRDAFIMDGVSIGDGAIIGARTMVAKDVPAYSVFVGNPGQVKRLRFTPDQIQKLLKIKWWTWDRETIVNRIEDFKDINMFVDKYGN